MVASIDFYGNTEAGIRDSLGIGLSGIFQEVFKVKLKINSSYSS